LQPLARLAVAGPLLMGAALPAPTPHAPATAPLGGPNNQLQACCMRLPARRLPASQ